MPGGAQGAGMDPHSGSHARQVPSPLDCDPAMGQPLELGLPRCPCLICQALPLSPTGMGHGVQKLPVSGRSRAPKRKEGRSRALQGTAHSSSVIPGDWGQGCGAGSQSAGQGAAWHAESERSRRRTALPAQPRAVWSPAVVVCTSAPSSARQGLTGGEEPSLRGSLQRWAPPGTFNCGAGHAPKAPHTAIATPQDEHASDIAPPDWLRPEAPPRPAPTWPRPKLATAPERSRFRRLVGPAHKR